MPSPTPAAPWADARRAAPPLRVAIIESDGGPRSSGEVLWPSDLTRLTGFSAGTRVLGSDQEPEGPDPIELFRTGCPSHPRAGMRLGRYRLLRHLGRGAQGDVWKALSLEGDASTPVALKVLNPAAARLASRRSQFRHEAERGARLAGPDLLRVLEFGEAQGVPFLVMPYVGGSSLAALIRARKARSDEESAGHERPLVAAEGADYLAGALRVVAAASRALGRIHAQRVVHRDVKPANILIEDRGLGVYLCDLGLGRDLDVATPEQMRDGAGTPMYMAPERLLRAPADERLCDIYGMGVTLYEAVTMERPFSPPAGLTHSLLSRFFLDNEPIPPRRALPELPPAVEAVILRAMARRPGDRYGSADELAAEVEGLIGHVGQGLPAPHIRVGGGRPPAR
ncbi:Serine/threonine-protein kinase PknB [Aquisphaera giovannonii]|uniref:Serine/threonine-protein kinase PknB n=1 Tax=Aquisphaera giovannonii TaxID=406548 RepID=A0A5B9W1C6_9BACT|nr:serine/threonine-protein kinase [Aquisphaera giovannonii]QEH34452.1 Serine/threonine-protein kinase PknB [Aquisphaera giovannonii]